MTLHGPNRDLHSGIFGGTVDNPAMALCQLVGKLRDKTDECLQFALSLDCVDCFTIGSESRTELADVVKKIPAASVRG